MKPYFFKKLGVIIIAFTFLFTLGCSLKEVKEEEHPKKAKVLLTNMNFQEKGEPLLLYLKEMLHSLILI